MAQAKSALAKSAKSNAEENPLLTYLLVFTLVLEVLISVWAFVHFGAGTNKVLAVDRFPQNGAEILMVITASTAGAAWFAIYRKRWAAYGLFSGLGLGLLWLWASPINLEGLKDGTEALPGWPVQSVVGLTLIAAVLLAILIAREWDCFE